MTSVTRFWAFGLIILTTILTTAAQFLLKSGLQQSLFNRWLIGGVVLYALGSAIMILAFKGGDVSELYPVFASSYIWVALIAYFVLGESVHWLRWTGIIVVIIGISLISFHKSTVPEVI